MVMMQCAEGCGNTVNEVAGRYEGLPTGPGGFRKATACDKCNRLHWTDDGIPVFHSTIQGKVFLNDRREVIIRRGQHETVFKPDFSDTRD